MPITGWLCPSCNATVPLDHFETNEVCGGVVAPAFAAHVLASDRERHGGEPTVHTTDVLGCPRKTAIAWQENVAVDPLKSTATFRGTGGHAILAANAPKACLPELPLQGLIDGVRMVGTADVVWPGRGLIEDYKFPNDFGASKRAKEGVGLEHVLQVSLYAEMVRQDRGVEITKGRIWYMFGSKHVPCDFEIIPLEGILPTTVCSSDWTVSKLLHDTSDLLAKPGAWKDAPLYGETMYFGANTACDYCPFKPMCWSQAKGAAF